MNEIWIGNIESIFGYGMSVVAGSEAECMKALRAEFKFAMKSRGVPPYEHFSSFKRAFEYFGGYVTKVTKGKVYSEGFRD